MKALVLTGTKQMEIQDLDVPTPKPNEVLVQTAYAGICGTDDALYNGLPGSADAVPPIVLGHENSGVVSAVGSDVVDFKPGDRVSIDPNIYCEKCKYCCSSRPQLCENLSAVGVTRNGGLEEYFTAPEKVVYHLPDEVSLEAGCSIEPLSCGVHGVDLLNIHPEYKALVMGDGYMGLLFVELLKAYGVHHVDLTGRHDDKLAEEQKLTGADHVINTESGDITEEYDIVIEAVGRPETQAKAVEIAAKGGQVLMFGVGRPDQTFSVNTYKVFQKELTIRGSFINPLTFEDSIALLASKKIEIEPLISNIITLEEVEGKLDGSDKRPGKSVVKVSDLK
ncbi:zinc-dependent alcohol dehydrogenase family protein [Lactobacillaceae bacterium Scapto_B20]